MDSNHRTLSGTDLQSVAFSHSATYPYLPLTRLELVTSPLPRECSTSEPQGHNSRTGLFNFHLEEPALTAPQKNKPVIGIEPTTYGLQNRCSTVELHRHMVYAILYNIWDIIHCQEKIICCISFFPIPIFSSLTYYSHDLFLCYIIFSKRS